MKCKFTRSILILVLLFGIWKKDAAAADFYIFSQSQESYLTESDIAQLTAQELCYARNEIYARHGRKFLSLELQEYFGQQDWYTPSVSPEEFSDAVFNEAELANIQLLQNREYSILPDGYALDISGYDISLVRPQSDAQSSQTTVREPCNSYADVVAQLESIYGPAGYSLDIYGMLYKMTGTCLVKLIDFDHNGQDELVVVYERLDQDYPLYWLEVWGQTDSGVRMLYEGDTCYGGDYAARGLDMTTCDGQEYIITGDFGYEQDYTWLGYKDGVFQPVMKCVFDDSSDCVIVNGERISTSQWQEEEQKWMENWYGWGFYSADVPNDLLEETNATKKQLKMDITERAPLAQGECGQDAVWSLDEAGVLTISGKGALYDYDVVPWAEYRSKIIRAVVEEGITELCSGCFFDCGNLKRAELPEGLIDLKSNLFRDCYSLESVNIPSTVTSIAMYSFNSCESLTSADLPEALENIGNLAFFDCPSLSRITFHGNLPSIGTNSFATVTADVSYPAGNETWTYGALTSYGGSLTWYGY